MNSYKSKKKGKPPEGEGKGKKPRQGKLNDLKDKTTSEKQKPEFNRGKINRLIEIRNGLEAQWEKMRDDVNCSWRNSSMEYLQNEISKVDAQLEKLGMPPPSDAMDHF